MQQVKDQIIAGEFDVFEGEILAQDGSVMVAAGEKLDDGAMLGMISFVQGVIGSAEG